MINAYEFGLITIDGKTYRRDVVVFWNGAVENWDRRTSHYIAAGDISIALVKKPEIVVIGTGNAGMAVVSDETKAAIIGAGARMAIEKTADAVDVFNDAAACEKRVVGLFHLTC